MNTDQFYSQLATDMQAVPDHESLTDQQVADAINARTIAGTRTIPAAELVAWAAARGKLAGIQSAALTPGATQSAAMAVAAIASSGSGAFDPVDIDHQEIIGSLIASGLLDQGDMDDLASRYTTSRPYVPATYGVTHVTDADIAHARSL